MKITNNQYISKHKIKSTLDRFDNHLNSQSTCNISTACNQSKNLSLFKGVSDEMYCGGNTTFEYAYFLLSNPNDSNVNIFVQNTITTNYSNYPISSKVYYCVEDIMGNLDSSNNITITNSNSSGKMPYGKIYFGNDLDKIYGTYGHNLIISPYSMYKSSENGDVIISPGYSYLFEINPINIENDSNFIMSFSWWEEPFSTFVD